MRSCVEGAGETGAGSWAGAEPAGSQGGYAAGPGSCRRSQAGSLQQRAGGELCSTVHLHIHLYDCNVQLQKSHCLGMSFLKWDSDER